MTFSKLQSKFPELKRKRYQKKYHKFEKIIKKYYSTKDPHNSYLFAFLGLIYDGVNSIAKLKKKNAKNIHFYHSSISG
ncbi:MAG: hypothetical protein BAJALOKI1v1_1150009 [Promethearchaeota archaeon]|nr:MAG: hypothetical protein BAJALOKI1v1_1150009 [Candidatus Lokiarchaeota archaeon]